MDSVAPAGPDQRTAPRRRAPMALLTWAFVALVLLIIVVLVVLKLTQGATTVPAPAVARAPSSVVHAVTQLPAVVFDAVGVSTETGPRPQPLTGQPPLTSAGRPEVVFVGAEFSPYSAAARWALVAALARFGTFRGLGATSSSAQELFPGTPTFTFDGTSYTSQFVSFTGVEAYGQTPSADAPAGFPVLHVPSGAVQSLLRRYDADGASSGAPALPFIDVGNRMLFIGAGIGFSPGLLHGQGMSQVATSMADPSHPAARAIVAAADEIGAAICAVDGGRPVAVCTSPGVRVGESSLGLA